MANLRVRLERLEQEAAPASGPLMIMEDAPNLEQMREQAERQGRHLIVVSYLDAAL